MATYRAFLLLSLVLALLLTVVTVSGADASATITWYVMSSGGGHATSLHYTLDATMGQPAPGLSSSPHYQLGSGFWYVMGAPQVMMRQLFLPVLLKNYL